MDIKDYINSGVTELYAMGALTDAERNEFEQKILMYPDLAREFNEIQQAISAFASVHAVNPRPSLRNEVLDAVVPDGSKSRGNSQGHSNEKNHILTYKYLIAASLAALAISTFASWFFYSRWEESEERYSEILGEKNQLAQNYNLVKDSFDKTLYDMLVMRDEQSEVIALHPIDTSKNYSVRIYWNHLSKDLYIDVLNLPEPSQQEQYQLWAIVKGQPVDAGTFDVHQFSGIQRLKQIDRADAWAVSLEPKGGSLVPSKEREVLASH